MVSHAFSESKSVVVLLETNIPIMELSKKQKEEPSIEKNNYFVKSVFT